MTVDQMIPVTAKREVVPSRRYGRMVSLVVSTLR